MKNILANPKVKEIIAYLFWGVMTTIVSWVSYSLFVFLFGFIKARVTILGADVSIAITIANALSWIIAVAFAFIVNKLYVFNSKSWSKSVYIPELWKFISARIATGILEIVCVPLLEGWGLNQSLFGIKGSLSKIVVSIAVVILNYCFSKLFVFNR